MKQLTEKDMREMRRIHESIPKEMKDRLMLKRSVTPTMKKALDMVLKEDLTAEQRRKFELVKKAGVFNQKEEVVNKKVEKEIDQYLTAEMLKSIRAGRLSEPEEGTKLYKIIHG